MATLYDSCLKALAEYSQACGRRLGAIDHGYDQAIDWIGEHRFRSFCTCVLFFCWPATADAGLFLGLTWPFFMLAFTFTFIFAEIPIMGLCISDTQPGAFQDALALLRPSPRLKKGLTKLDA